MNYRVCCRSVRGAILGIVSRVFGEVRVTGELGWCVACFVRGWLMGWYVCKDVKQAVLTILGWF